MGGKIMLALDWEQLSAKHREREYSPSSCIGGDYQPFLEDYAALSAAARLAHRPATFRYGAKPGQTLDLFRPEGDGAHPAIVFFHGGYWQELSKDDSAFPALPCLAQKTAFVAVDYTLAPQATLDDIVAECAGAIAWLARFGRAVGIDPQRIVVSGSSAGAHLAAMAALASNSVKGAVLVSGIYDLEPLIGTSINAVLRLDVPACRRNSPLRLDLSRLPRSVVAWGEIETEQAKRQSRLFAARLESLGVPVTAFEVAGRNHFDVVLDLADPATPLGQHLHALVRATES